MGEQDRKPCKECPFSPTGQLGGSLPTRYIGQAHGPFMLSCHMDPGYDRDKRNPELLQCAGAAIFRANVGISEQMPDGLLKLPVNKELAFPDSAALLAHWSGMQLESAELFLKIVTPEDLLRSELQKSGVQRVFVRKKEETGD